MADRDNSLRQGPRGSKFEIDPRAVERDGAAQDDEHAAVVERLGDRLKPILARVPLPLARHEHVDRAEKVSSQLVPQPTGDGAILVNVTDEDRAVAAPLHEPTVGA